MNKYNKKDLEKYILIDKIPYEELGKLYGVSGTAIKKAALRLGLELPRKRTINPNETFNKGKIFNPKGICINCGKEFIQYASKSNKYCSFECQHEYEHKQKYQLIIEGDPSIMRANYTASRFKSDILKEQNGICAICGMLPEWNG